MLDICYDRMYNIIDGDIEAKGYIEMIVGEIVRRVVYLRDTTEGWGPNQCGAEFNRLVERWIERLKEGNMEEEAKMMVAEYEHKMGPSCHRSIYRWSDVRLEEMDTWDKIEAISVYLMPWDFIYVGRDDINL